MKTKTKEEAFEVVEKYIRKGARLHAFLSGGGLRVLRVEKVKSGKLLGYGEHPDVNDAFRILADDLKAGGRDYDDVYNNEEETAYLTGQSEPTDKLDAWVRKGYGFDAFIKNKKMVFVLKGWEHQPHPGDIEARVRAGETVEWESPRGYRFKSHPDFFPNGEAATVTETIFVPVGKTRHHDWMWQATKTGQGDTLAQAMEAAFEAEPVEI